ncbi:MAG: 30S ribosomal protein S6 [Deltaproteobacteria bacterium]|nr:30S ribosomal protein S6 [Deltaproteobacteria bacterium]MBW2334209.1 30S ribosomal protein S6 [Deltaproteobacteria bacterium]
MNHYETIYIVNPTLDDDSLKEAIDKFSDLIKKLKGTIVKINEWGKRKLAYDVKRFDKGYYVVLDFCALPKMLTELERNLKLDDRILKYITVKIDENVDPKDLVSKEKEIEDTMEESHNEHVEEK